MPKKKKPRKIITYELQDLRRLKIDADKLVLGADPGSANFGIALVGLKNSKIKIYANSVMMHPVNNLVNFVDSSAGFVKELKHWMAWKPEGIVAERFQTRGNSGPLIEYVSSMLGLIRGTYPRVPIKLTIASTWKLRLQKRFDVDLKEIYPTCKAQPHQLDAALIGVYGLECGTEQIIDYDLDDIIAQVEATSLIGIKK